jgi:hypothetical protein
VETSQAHVVQAMYQPFLPRKPLQTIADARQSFPRCAREQISTSRAFDQNHHEHVVRAGDFCFTAGSLEDFIGMKKPECSYRGAI